MMAGVDPELSRPEHPYEAQADGETTSAVSEGPQVDLFWRTWTSPKDGKTDRENEDAVRVTVGGAGTGRLWCAAVADGATGAIYSALWARTLVAAAEPDWPELDDARLTARLDAVRGSFSPLSSAGDIPWFARDKYLLVGSQATLLVATLRLLPDGDRLSLRAAGVGDSCVLVIRSTGEVEPFPVESSTDFGVDPALVRERAQPSLPYRRWETTIDHGDIVLACTDAVAAWCLRRVEAGEGSGLVQTLLDLVAPSGEDSPVAVSLGSGGDHDAEAADGTAELPPPLDAFGRFLARWRSAGSQPRMRNDDATLALLVPVRATDTSVERDAAETLQRLGAGGAFSVTRRTAMSDSTVSASASGGPPAQEG